MGDTLGMNVFRTTKKLVGEPSAWVSERSYDGNSLKGLPDRVLSQRFKDDTRASQEMRF
jgi:hypothetical protein